MKKNIVIITLFLLLAGSAGYIIYSQFNDDVRFVSYLQDEDEIYNMTCGIIHNCEEFRDGDHTRITYEFEDPKYQELIEKYDLLSIAGDGSQFDKAIRLMDHFSGRLEHNGNFTEYTPDMNSLDLLEYALGEEKHGINCRAKAQIMNEEYLALGIYSRKLWLNPLSVYDGECHVVNEIWDEVFQKWIMLDTTNDIYWVGADRIPLSAIEVREKLASQEFVTPVIVGENTSDLEKLKNKHMDLILYTAKNMAYLQYFIHYGTGEDDIVYTLFPENIDLSEGSNHYLLSKDSLKDAPDTESRTADRRE